MISVPWQLQLKWDASLKVTCGPAQDPLQSDSWSCHTVGIDGLVLLLFYFSSGGAQLSEPRISLNPSLADL